MAPRLQLTQHLSDSGLFGHSSVVIHHFKHTSWRPKVIKTRQRSFHVFDLTQSCSRTVSPLDVTVVKGMTATWTCSSPIFYGFWHSLFTLRNEQSTLRTCFLNSELYFMKPTDGRSAVWSPIYLYVFTNSSATFRPKSLWISNQKAGLIL